VYPDRKTDTGVRAASVPLHHLPAAPALLRLCSPQGDSRLALWRDGALRDLSAAADADLHSLDALLRLPVGETRRLLESNAIAALPELDPDAFELLPPVESQEVWGAGVTYFRSREARMEEATEKDIYASVYRAARPELFFKGAGWRVIPPGGRIGIRPDSTWDVPEPELAVLSNAHGEVIGYTCGNDMSSRSIEGENPLYLAQAKVYEASCSLGPGIVPAWHVHPATARIDLTIERADQEVYSSTARVSDMVRVPAELVSVLYAAYPLPSGAWLLTGTGIVPPSTYTARAGDVITIEIEGLGVLTNIVRQVTHTGAQAPPHLTAPSPP